MNFEHIYPIFDRLQKITPKASTPNQYDCKSLDRGSKTSKSNRSVINSSSLRNIKSKYFGKMVEHSTIDKKKKNSRSTTKSTLQENSVTHLNCTSDLKCQKNKKYANFKIIARFKSHNPKFIVYEAKNILENSNTSYLIREPLDEEAHQIQKRECILKKELQLLSSDTCMQYLILPLKVLHTTSKGALLYYCYGKPLTEVNLQSNEISLLLYDISKALSIFHNKELVHSNVNPANVLRKMIKNQNYKIPCFSLGGFEKCFKHSERSKFANRNFEIWTPPEIINYMMFEQNETGFKRELLDTMHDYHFKCAYDVWSLGVLILSQLSQLDESIIKPEQLLNYQLTFGLKCCWATRILPKNLSVLIQRMISIDPNLRPTVKEIINLCKKL